MTAVFDTNELVHLIIDAVPREHRTRLLRVSKAWRAATMKLGHVVEPIGYRFMSNLLHPWLPMYPPDIAFKINRGFSSYTSYVSKGDPKPHNILLSQQRLKLYDSVKLSQKFLTDPPITQLAICNCENAHIASLQVRGGIRVGHLRECLRKINGSTFTYDTWATYCHP
jgi:hypothetical protein